LARARFKDGQPAGLRQNQRVQARILIEEKPGVLLLARGPFVESGGGRFVYVLDHGMATRRAIRMGSTSVSAVEIVDGLRLGERVVIAGSENFAEAISVRVIE
jgi:HlyD family secretion protein